MTLKKTVFGRRKALYKKLVAAYKLSDGTDSHINSYNASTLTSINFNNTNAVDGNAAQFPLKTSRFIIPYNSSFVFSDGTSDKKMSIKANIYLTRIADTVNYIFGRHTGTTNNSSEYVFYVRTSGQLAFLKMNKAAGGVYIGAQSPANSIVLNTAYNVIVTDNGSNSWTGVKMWINGVAQTLTSLNNGTGYTCMSNTNTGLDTNIGKVGTSSFDSPLTIDEVYLFNDELTAEEIAILQTNYYPNF